MLALAATAWGVARALAAAGTTAGWQVLVGAGTVLSTPLFGYGASDFGEPLAAALVAIGVGLVAAIRLEGTTPRRQTAAGFALGALPLLKSLYWVLALPLLVAAALPPKSAEGARRKKAPAERAQTRLLAAAAIPAFLWALLELVRFGRLLGGYGGETFTYPLLTGLLRLTLLPNKGLLVYAPLVALAFAGLPAFFRRDRPLGGGVAFGAAALLTASAAWWAWDGQAGWGPRLVLPAIPLLIATLGPLLTSSGVARRATVLLLVAGFLVNLPGALQPFPPVYALATTVPLLPISESRAAGTPYEITRDVDGTLRATGPHHLSLTPSWAPPLVHARLLAERLRGGDVAARLSSRGLGLHPPFAPVVPDNPHPAFVQGLTPFSWPFWGRSWIAPQPGGEDPLGIGLHDQLVRALDMKRFERASGLARALLSREGSSPRTTTLSLAAEAAQLAGRSGDAGDLLSRTSEPCHPWVLFVKRRRGEGIEACLPLEYRAGFVANVDAAQSAGAPLTEWARRALQAEGPSR
jgi:hypothetical protein